MKPSFKHKLSYLSIRLIGFFLALLPQKALYLLAKVLSFFACHFRLLGFKRVINNLALAKKLPYNLKEKKDLCFPIFENFFIVFLEYFKLKSYSKQLSSYITCENPEFFDSLVKRHGSVIIASGHQANWELPFLAITEKYPAVAIATPLKNPLLNKWIVSLRKLFKGHIIVPKDAVNNSLRYLQKDTHLALIFDQAYPDSNFYTSFLGNRAWNTLGPGIMSYRSKKPLVFISSYRKKSHYYFRYHLPLVPYQKTMKQEAERLMCQLMQLLEKEILKHPHQWLWQHNRWKQVGVNHLPKKFRHSFLLVLLPKDQSLFYASIKALKVLFKLYKGCFFKILYPKQHEEFILKENEEVQYHGYSEEKECLKQWWEVQIVFDFTQLQSPKVAQHYLNLAAFLVLNIKNIQDLSQRKDPSVYELHKMLEIALQR